MFSKSGVIRIIWLSPQTAETRVAMILVDDSINKARQISILFKDDVNLRYLLIPGHY